MATTVNYGYDDAQIHNESPRSTFIYKDLNLYFTKNPLSSDVSKVTDVQAIKRSVRNLILTKQGERLFHPEIGGNVHTQLFNLFTPIVRVELQDSIADVIEHYEPRAQIQEIVINDDFDNNQLNIQVRFALVNVPNEIHEVDVFLNRIR